MGHCCGAVWWVSYILLEVLILAVSESEKEPVNIKIVEAPALSRFPSMPSSSNKLTLRAKPSPLSGPPHLLQLRDKCFTGNEKGYTYKLCMFNNVTQKEDRTGWNSFHGVLGVWHEWIITNDTFTGMHYTMGESCATSDRETKVMFHCSPSTLLHNFTEPSTCSYHMTLDTPLACFKGAMQVYHTLSPDQLKEWDRLSDLFYAEELTFKGLTNKRQKLLVEAGLLQEASKEEITSAPSASPSPESSSEASELSRCLKDKGSLESHIKDLKVKVLQVVKDYPELRVKLGLIFNSTSPSPDPALSHAPGSEKHVEGGAKQQEEAESLLSDDDVDLLVDDLLGEEQEFGQKNDIIRKKTLDKEEYDLDAFLEELELSEHYHM